MVPHFHPLLTMPEANDRIRLTISVSPSVHATFTEMAQTSGLSLSRCMGEWLDDTVESAQFVTAKMREARAAPALVMREMHSMSLGLTDSVNDLMASVRAKAADTRKRSAAVGAVLPPSSNTGGKSPGKTRKAGRA